MREENIDYKGYRIALFRLDLGWHTFIYPPGSAIPIREVPMSAREDGRADVVREAQEAIDQHVEVTLARRALDPPPAARRRRWRLFG
jgi:hypothetical protein